MSIYFAFHPKKEESYASILAFFAIRFNLFFAAHGIDFYMTICYFN